MARYFHKMSDGFTLVEVVVVAVIVSILAATAIPLYLNYITTSRNEVASNAAGGIATFCAACVNGGGLSADWLPLLKVTSPLPATAAWVIRPA